MSTSQTRAKRKYNNANYSRIVVDLPQDLVLKFKTKCKEEGVSQASVLRNAIENYIKKEPD